METNMLGGLLVVGSATLKWTRFHQVTHPHAKYVSFLEFNLKKMPRVLRMAGEAYAGMIDKGDYPDISVSGDFSG